MKEATKWMLWTHCSPNGLPLKGLSSTQYARMDSEMCEYAASMRDKKACGWSCGCEFHRRPIYQQVGYLTLKYHGYDFDFEDEPEIRSDILETLRRRMMESHEQP